MNTQQEELQQIIKEIEQCDLLIKENRMKIAEQKQKQLSYSSIEQSYKEESHLNSLIQIVFKDIVIQHLRVPLTSSIFQQRFRDFSHQEEILLILFFLTGIRKESNPIFGMCGQLSNFLQNFDLQTTTDIELLKTNKGYITLSKHTFLKVKNVEKKFLCENHLVTIECTIIDPLFTFDNFSPLINGETPVHLKEINK